MRLMHVIPLLGIAQIISWGTLYYTVGIVSQPLRVAAGVSEVFLFGAFTASLLMSGIAAPHVGRWIDAPRFRQRGRRGEPWTRALLGAVSLAMAAIPEEFPIVLTLFLSVGAWRLASRGMLVRRLASVETLGSTTVICTDKTGTLTQNRMAARFVWASGKTSSSAIKGRG